MHSSESSARNRHTVHRALAHWFVLNQGVSHSSCPLTHEYSPYSSLEKLSSLSTVSNVLDEVERLWNSEPQKVQGANDLRNFWSEYPVPSSEHVERCSQQTAKMQAFERQYSNRLQCTDSAVQQDQQETPRGELTDMLAQPAAALVSLAEDSGTPQDTLASLAIHTLLDVRQAVCDNPNTSAETLRLLCNDYDPDVRYVLASNHNIQLEILSVLVEDENPYVAARAQQTIKHLQAPSQALTTHQKTWSTRTPRLQRIDLGA